ncbi:hypothetical protein M422DRAFT_243108, partial [Sphaerobolus stellatus SS14]
MADPHQNDSYNQNNPPPNYELMHNMEYGLTMQIGDVGTSGLNLNSPYSHQAASPINQGIPATAQPSSTWTSFTPGGLFHNIVDVAVGSRQSVLPPAAQPPPSSQSPIVPPLCQSSLAPSTTGNPAVLGAPSKALSDRVPDGNFSDGPQDDVSDALDDNVSDAPDDDVGDVPLPNEPLDIDGYPIPDLGSFMVEGEGRNGDMSTSDTTGGNHPLSGLFGSVPSASPAPETARGKGSVPSSHPACPALIDLASPFNAEAANYVPECWEDYISIIKCLSFNFGWSQGINPCPPHASNVRNIFWQLYKKPVNNIVGKELEKLSLMQGVAIENVNLSVKQAGQLRTTVVTQLFNHEAARHDSMASFSVKLLDWDACSAAMSQFCMAGNDIHAFMVVFSTSPSSRSEESVLALTTNQAVNAALVSMGFAELKTIAAALQTVIKWKAHAAFTDKVKMVVAAIGSIAQTLVPAMKTMIDLPASQAEALKNLATGCYVLIRNTP